MKGINIKIYWKFYVFKTCLMYSCTDGILVINNKIYLFYRQIFTYIFFIFTYIFSNIYFIFLLS